MTTQSHHGVKPSVLPGSIAATPTSPGGFSPMMSTTSGTSSSSHSTVGWIMCGGGFAGGLLSLGSLILPWLCIDAIFVRFSLSPFGIAGFEESLGTADGFFTLLGLTILLVGLVAALAGIASGVTGAVAGIASVSNTFLRTAAALSAVAGLGLMLFCGLVFIYAVWVNNAAELGGMAASVGLFVAALAALLMASGGTTTLICSFIAKRPTTAFPQQQPLHPASAI